MNSTMQGTMAPLAFFPDRLVSEDEERPGLLRAETLGDPDDPEFLEFHSCELKDWSQAEQSPLHLEKMGFDAIDLSGSAQLQDLLQGIRRAGEISEDNARDLRRKLTGRVFRLSSGKRLLLRFIAAEGLIMRVAGPNGLDPNPDVEMGEMNGHRAATAVHGDQDVRGTPLKQMMRGFAPKMFRHQSPDSRNRWSPLMLINLWIPLDQVTRPLALMDRRTLDARRHQLRYALPTDAFLDRDQDMVVNDIWTFLHDERQRWYFHSDMDSRSAYVFDTLGEPHGSTILPGEELAEQCYRALVDAAEALQKQEWERAAGLAGIAGAAPPAQCPDALARAIGVMQALLRELPAAQAWDSDARALWLRNAEEARSRVVRKSLEMRVVALQLPAWWPFNR